MTSGIVEGSDGVQPVVVALIWHHPVMRTDVFPGARSGDAGRLVRFFAAFVGYGLAALAALGVVVAILAFVGG